MAVDSLLSEMQGKTKVFVFESEQAGRPYSSRSAQAIFQQAKQKAASKKKWGSTV